MSPSLSVLREALAHRGPDDRGAQEFGQAGLAHTRLSIIDLSPAGHQPMSNEDGTAWITYNGEFYNFGDYRAELESRGHAFRSHSDTETILHLYEDRGVEKTLAAINGMFAFGLWDARRRELVLARDRLGKKPLYYILRPDGSIVFASEIKALVAAGQVDRQALDLEALDEVWTLGYTTGARTIYRDVRRLPPAHYAIWRNGRLDIRRYWTCPFGREPISNRSEHDLLDELEALLCDAIGLRLIADVPVGLFLSGGIDSSVVAALTARKLGRCLKAYTIAFRQSEFNEAPQAERIAHRLGLDQQILTVDEDMAAQFGRIVRHFDEPFGDASSIPTWFVSRLTREHAKVVLTGDGGDELFAGYDEYQRGLGLWGRGAVRTLGTPSGGRRDALLRMVGPEWGYALMQRHLGGSLRRKVFSGARRRHPSHWRTLRIRPRWMREIPAADALTKMQYADINTYLADDVLVKVDRMSMAHALECRSPLLDHRVAEFAARLPVHLKIAGPGVGKYILRKLLARHVPESEIASGKRGFTPPWAAWCVGGFRDDMRARWEKVRKPFFGPKSGRVVFPRKGEGSPVLQWLGYSTLEFLEMQAAKGEGPQENT